MIILENFDCQINTTNNVYVVYTVLSHNTQLVSKILIEYHNVVCNECENYSLSNL